ncbi:MAG: tRNA dihydrouridine synthase DusB [Desulfuromonas sp.]|uniref:tRNA dihydrouridine synthase DusB n=1 Tax=Desulfuromonas sp. TaxID=892 RepID=UPI000CB8F792|nr:tRNA dihydrouridine synthase DusB [Desulfuromonas sp.]PLX83654.1 MAG: tRNA dihydrouridine synthase DusB [Desulfuromonas sp.]
MRIANLTIDNNVILAPMAGITDLPYRRLMKGFGAGLVFTEMVSANGLIRAGRRTRELLRSRPGERPLGIQLFGEDPEVLAEAAQQVNADGELLDLNLGCPVPKVVRNGAGSALLRDPVKAGKVVAAVRRATDLPLTVKIRSGWDHQSVNFLEVGRIAASEGADAVTLHPRTRSQGFSGQADWEHIRRLKETLAVPVIGSGDIFNAEDALAMLRQTGCDAVMVGRGAYGNPWLIRDILALQRGLKPAPPSPPERLQAALLHLNLFLESFDSKKAVLDMRKHLAWYSRGLPGATAFRTLINRLQTVEEVRQAMEDFFSGATPLAEEHP